MFLLLALPVLLSLNLSYSQERPIKKFYDIKLMYGTVSSSNNFLRLSNLPNCCPEQYDNGNGYSFLIPISYNFKLAKNVFFYSGINFQYENLDFSYLEEEVIDEGLAFVNHSLNSSILFSGFDFGLKIRTKKISLNSGFNLSFPIQNEYSQVETLLEGSFDSIGTNQRNKFDNKSIEFLNPIAFRLFTSVSYHINFSKEWSIAPTVALQFDLLNLHSQENDWTTNSIFFGLNFTYDIFYQESNPIQPAKE